MKAEGRESRLGEKGKEGRSDGVAEARRGMQLRLHPAQHLRSSGPESLSREARATPPVTRRGRRRSCGHRLHWHVTGTCSPRPDTPGLLFACVVLSEAAA
eukprot:1232663-Rhodomonas_salina.1